MSPVYSEPIAFSLRVQLTGLLLPAISSERHTKKVSREISCLLFQEQLSRPKMKHKISAPKSHLTLKASSALQCSRASESLCRMGIEADDNWKTHYTSGKFAAVLPLNQARRKTASHADEALLCILDRAKQRSGDEEL